ncbi:MAG: Lrp/AsnC ligand binding domain-containing protein [Octadecabacter sp.]
MPERFSKMDSFDRKILDVMAIEGRISVTELARRIGLSKSPTQARLKRLEDNGVIRGYRALFDPIRLGRDHVAFVEVKLSDTRETALAAFNAAVTRVPEIEQCHLIAGSFDYLLKVRTSSMSSYRLVLAEKISTLPHVANTSTYVAMQAVKEEGVVPVTNTLAR